MRFFRIPAFTGIETHRDDADRGSLRVVEGCLPHGPGGLRSGPVWENVGAVDIVSQTEENQMTAADDGNGNSALFVSRLDEVHDMAIVSTEHTSVSIFGSSYQVIDPIDLYEKGRAVLTPVGSRLFAFGDGDGEAVFAGKGPPAIEDTKIFPDARLYSFEFSRFPNCQFFVQGPKKTLFAAGNPKRPLTVYISEPAGKTKAYRDTPYSTEEPTGDAYAGQLSTVDILMSNATYITALSSRGDQVVVHTDKGCHILYAPKGDQASTGYRVEQVAATNFSAAVNTQVVAGEVGSMSFWLGHDGQIYKDESASRGAEDAKSFADPDQASWKSKGLWEKELPVDLSQSFAAYDRESGMYWIYVRSDEFNKSVVNDVPGRVINVEALPDLPGQATLNSVSQDAPSSISNLTTLPDLPGQVTLLQAAAESSIDLPGQVTGLNTSPDLPGQVTGLNTAHDLPGQVTGLNTAPDLPGQADNLIVQGNTVPGQVGALSALPDIPGQVSITSILPDLPGAVTTGGSVLPDIPGLISLNSVLPDLSGQVTQVNAEAEPPDLSCPLVNGHLNSGNELYLTSYTNINFAATNPFQGIYTSTNAPFPDTISAGTSYVSSSGLPNLIWAGSSQNKPNNGGFALPMGLGNGSSHPNNCWHIWGYLQPDGQGNNSAQKFNLDAVQFLNGSYNAPREYELYTNVSGKYNIRLIAGSVTLGQWQNTSTEPCQITGFYTSTTGGGDTLVVGKNPFGYQSNSARAGAYHTDGTSFTIPYAF